MSARILGRFSQLCRTRHFGKKLLKRLVPLGLALWLAPVALAIYVCCGLLDVLRNERRCLGTLDRYFAGNGCFTWLLSCSVEKPPWGLARPRRMRHERYEQVPAGGCP
jgi:hypothetical protein